VHIVEVQRRHSERTLLVQLVLVGFVGISEGISYAEGSDLALVGVYLAGKLMVDLVYGLVFRYLQSLAGPSTFSPAGILQVLALWVQQV
jgi:hypothetical protein